MTNSHILWYEPLIFFEAHDKLDQIGHTDGKELVC